jgi:hypothetical protein
MPHTVREKRPKPTSTLTLTPARQTFLEKASGKEGVCADARYDAWAVEHGLVKTREGHRRFLTKAGERFLRSRAVELPRNVGRR